VLRGLARVSQGVGAAAEGLLARLSRCAGPCQACRWALPGLPLGPARPAAGP